MAKNGQKMAKNWPKICFCPGGLGPMLWFLKYFRQKIQRKNCRFWLKTKKLNYAKFWSWHWCLRKTPIFSPKLSKIAENCDHNIDPRSSSIGSACHLGDWSYIWVVRPKKC
jgi:hypothetical protein